jgi:cation diffusion facilitator CzcD-associated flavoprotein CzcO
VGERNQRDTDPAEWAEITKEPGWQRRRIENFTGSITGKHPEVNMVNDGWSDLLGEDPKRAPRDEDDARHLEEVDFQKMQKLRDRIDSIVLNPETAEKLKPWYKVSCKRPCFHDDYLPTYNRGNVHLIDTDGAGVSEITERGVIANGQEYPVDILIFSTGFEVLSFYTHRLGFDPKGVGGVPMSVAWEKGPSTLFGVMAHGFPNLLMNSTIQGGQDVNFAFTLTQTGEQIAYTISKAVERGATRVESVESAEEEWFNLIAGTALHYGLYFTDCTPSYLNNEAGAPSEYAMKTACYMGSAVDWAELLRQWRAADKLEGLALT